MNNAIINRALAAYNPNFSQTTIKGSSASSSNQTIPQNSTPVNNNSSKASKESNPPAKTQNPNQASVSSTLPPQTRDVVGKSQSELNLLQKLQQREMEVRAHEQAHISAGGRYIKGGADYTYKMGPDGRLYAVGGEVSIDTNPVPNDPEATIEKAETIRQAALAPKEPSSSDLQVAAKASRMESEARAKLNNEENNVAIGQRNDQPGDLVSNKLIKEKDEASGPFPVQGDSDRVVIFEAIRQGNTLQTSYAKQAAMHYSSCEKIGSQSRGHQSVDIMV